MTMKKCYASVYRYKKELAPLRRIVGLVTARPNGDNYGHVYLEELECSHLAMNKQDIIGATRPTRRRCRQCLKEEDWYEGWYIDDNPR